MKNFGKLIVCVLLCLGVGFICNIFVQEALHKWYPSLTHPEGAPLKHFHTPIWTILYILVGISLWCAINAHVPKHAYALFSLLLLLQLFWSFFLFGMHSIFLGLVDITFLMVITGCTIAAFWKFSKPASLLLAPYFVWILYVTYLNFGFFLLNRNPP